MTLEYFETKLSIACEVSYCVAEIEKKHFNMYSQRKV